MGSLHEPSSSASSTGGIHGNESISSSSLYSEQDSQSYDADQVFQAITSFYTQGPSQSKDADKWLKNFQKSAYAWQVCDNLLTTKRSKESCFFAAQTLKSKLIADIHELPKESFEGLRESLLSHLETFAKLGSEVCPANLSTQLILAIADLTLQMPAWQDPVKDMITRYIQDEVYLTYLLEYLTLLPEELHNKALRLGNARRQSAIATLQASSGMVLDILKKLLTDFKSLNHNSLMKLFKCLGAWGNLALFDVEELYNSNILAIPFQIIQVIPNPEDHLSAKTTTLANGCSSELHEIATDCVCSIMWPCENINKYWPISLQIAEYSLQTFQLCWEGVIQQDDLDKSTNLARLFIELNESLLQILVDAQYIEIGEAPNIILKKYDRINVDTQTAFERLSSFGNLDPVLATCSHPSFEVTQITFNYFHRMADYLYSIGSHAMCAMFRETVEKLILALWKQMAVDEDTEGLIDEANDHDIFEFRRRSGELIADTAFIAGPENIAAEIWRKVKDDSGNWTKSEAGLEVISCVCFKIDSNENQVIPEIMGAVLSLAANSSTHIALKSAGLKLLGHLSDWMGVQDGGKYLTGAMDFIMKTMQDSDLASVASKTLSDVCKSRSCKPLLVPYADHLTTLIKQADEQHDLPHDSAVALYAGIASILTNLNNNEICEKIMVLLESIVKQLSEERNKTFPPIKIYDKLAAVYRSLFQSLGQLKEGEVSPIYQPLNQTWGYFKENYQLFGKDLKCTERWCRLIRFGVRGLQRKVPDDDMLISSICEFLPQAFQAFQHSALLYLASILIDDFYCPATVAMYKPMITHCLKMSKNPQTGEIDLAEIPDTIDDLFRLCTRIVQRDSSELLNLSNAPELVETAVAVTKLQHQDAHTSGMKFLEELFQASGLEVRKQGDANGITTQVCMNFGEQIVKDSLKNVVLVLPKSMFIDTAEVWHEIKTWNTDYFDMWLRKAFQEFVNLPEIQAIMSNYDITQEPCYSEFVRSVLECNRADDITDSLHNFARLFR